MEKITLHWFITDPEGPIATHGGGLPVPLPKMAGHPGMRGFIGGVRGRIACQPQRSDINPKTVNGMTVVCAHSDDVRAANCPRCLATPEAKAMLERLGEVQEEVQTK
jgi:hypothetical protein